MTISEYLQELDETISSAPEVLQVDILRRSVWDTGMEIVAIYRYKPTMSDGSLLELAERLIENSGQRSSTRYRFHWQTSPAEVMKRWDNAAHHAKLASFPHHLHDGSETHVVSHGPINGIAVVRRIIADIANRQ